MENAAEESYHGVSRETLRRLETFVELLQRWTPRVNLLAPADLGDVWKRHIWDSAQLLCHIPPHAQLAADIGSGAGFPGLVLSIISGLPFTLIEADRRKAAFLREAALATSAPAAVVAQRAETIGRHFDLVTARAVAPLHQLIHLAVPLLASGGQCLFLKGRSAATEIARTERCWDMNVEKIRSSTSDGYVLAITNIESKRLSPSR